MTAHNQYGELPHRLILLHGGPGAIGDLREVAVRMSEQFGIIEILNKGKSIDQQIEEIYRVFCHHNIRKATIAGHSWGSWLGLLFTLRYPELVSKLIFISCPSFKQADKEQTTFTRISRLKDNDRIELEKLSLQIRRINSEREKNETFSRLGSLIKKADTYQAAESGDKKVPADYGVFSSIWPEAESLRRSGELKRCLGNLNVEVTAIHGDYDPHPASAVEKELKEANVNYRFFLLSKCGHYPWIEKFAREEFFSIFSAAVK